MRTTEGCRNRRRSRRSPPAAAVEDRTQPNPDRNAYFGDEHLHTSWSVDAWVMGNRLTGPAEALKYAQGETIKHPLGYDIKIDTPLDFMGVTDHAEYVGVTKEANTPGSAISKLPEAQPLILKDPNNKDEVNKVFLYLLSLTSKPPIKAFMSPQVAGTVWKENVRHRRREQSSRQVHRLLLVRVHLPVQLPEPAPQHLLPRLRQGPRAAVQHARFLASGGPVEVDGHAAQGRQ